MAISPLSGQPDGGAPLQDRDLRKTAINPDFWYPLLRSRRLKPAAVVSVHFGDQPIALIRTKSGKLFALEDRCAHRQVPISAGVVEGETVRCCYHGWTYDCSGRCVNIPYVGHSELIPRGVRSYPCREEYGLIWVFPGNAERADSVLFPDVPAWRDPHYKTRYLDHEVGCHYSFLHENLMDMNHQFLHRRIMAKIRTTFLGLREGEDWVEVDYTFSRIGKQPLGEKFMLGRRPDTPDPDEPNDLMTVRTQYPYQILKFWTDGSEHPALDLWITYVPVDAEQRRNRTFALMNIRKPTVPGLMELLWPFIVWFTNGIFAEDKWVVEMEQAAFERQDGDENQEIFPVILSVRNLLLRKGVPMSTAELQPSAG